MYQPLFPKLCMMGGLSQNRSSLDSSWTSGQDNLELKGNPSSNLYWVQRVSLRVRIRCAHRDMIQGV